MGSYLQPFQMTRWQLQLLHRAASEEVSQVESQTCKGSRKNTAPGFSSPLNSADNQEDHQIPTKVTMIFFHGFPIFGRSTSTGNTEWAAVQGHVYFCLDSQSNVKLDSLSQWEDFCGIWNKFLFLTSSLVFLPFRYLCFNSIWCNHFFQCLWWHQVFWKSRHPKSVIDSWLRVKTGT